MADLAQFRSAAGGSLRGVRERAERVSSTLQVRYRMNDYSVPMAYGYRDIVVKGLRRRCRDPVWRRRDRAAQAVLRTGRVRLRSASLPGIDRTEAWRARSGGGVAGLAAGAAFTDLRRMLETRMGNQGKREFIQVLRLMETFSESVVATAAATRSGSARQASTPSSNSSLRASSIVRHASIRQPIPICRSRPWPPRAPPTTRPSIGEDT